MTPKILITMFLIACMTIGCGGENYDGEIDNPKSFTGPPINEKNKDLTVDEIAGVWKFDIENYGPENEVWAMDEYYVVITPNGEYYEYDYLGDSRSERQGNYGNCYTLRNRGSIEKLPEGGFQIQFESAQITFFFYTNYEFKDDKLWAATTIFDTDNTFASSSSLSRAEMEQLSCEEE